jgi:hypothetical protein
LALRAWRSASIVILNGRLQPLSVDAAAGHESLPWLTDFECRSYENVPAQYQDVRFDWDEY